MPRAPGQERFTRLKTLGADYTEEAITERINSKRTRAAKAPRAGISGKLPSVAAMQAEYGKLQEQKEALYADYGKTSDELTVCSIYADKDLLKRAISNLVQNCINHNENGCTIYVSVATDHCNCMICVEDNSIGASDEQIKKLNHAPHYMVCDTTATQQRHGLGLLIVRQVIDGHGGTVTINHSEYGDVKVVLSIPQ